MDDERISHKVGDILFVQMNRDRNSLTPSLNIHKSDEGGFALTSFGYVMSRDEYARFSEQTTLFYATHSDEDISQLNRETDEYWRNERGEIRKPIRMAPTRSSQPGFIYVIKCNDLHKIGKSKQVTKRIEKFETIYPHDLEVVFVAKVNDMHGAECYLHSKFSSQRIKGEWFNLTPNDVDQIRQQYQHVEDWRNTL